MRTWVRNTAFSLQICKLAIYGTSRKFVDLQFADLIITNLRIFNLRTSTPQKFADSRLRNEPKNLQICDFAD
jgi:hypothetical protein